MSITLNGNGHHPLPKRTEDYLISGAPEGSRNTELFQPRANCAMRGIRSRMLRRSLSRAMSPMDAANGRQLATIRSAYSRPPRDPIPSPRDQVEQLVNRYGRQTEAQERPTAAQIAETVRACAGMNPVEWAETRQRLKTVCGDGLKVADLDRMYRKPAASESASQRLTAKGQSATPSGTAAWCTRKRTSAGCPADRRRLDRARVGMDDAGR